jgi:hypothetical protein
MLRGPDNERVRMKHDKLLAALAAFDSLPGCAGVTIPVGCAVTGRSRASLYRDIAARRIEAFKINGSTRIRVDSLRNLLSAGSS